MSRIMFALALACAGSVLIAPDVIAQEVGQVTSGANALPSPASQVDNPSTQPVVWKPSDPNDYGGWNIYFTGIARKNALDMPAGHAYLFFVPSGSDPDSIHARERQLDNLKGIVARRIKPGNLIAFSGPSSQITADIVLGAFENAPADSLKGVVLLFIGLNADRDRVFDCWRASGATLRFADMSGANYPVGQLPPGAAPAHMIGPPPPPMPLPPGVGTSGSSVQSPAYLDRRAPVYPGFDAVYGIEGSTGLLILVDKSGQPVDIKVERTSGHRDMDIAALNAAKHWRFSPELKNGVPVDGYVRIPIQFNAGFEGDKRWPKDYLGAPYVLDEAPVPYATVNDALTAVAALAHEGVYDDQKKHFQAYVLRDPNHVISERWYFMDVTSTRAMAVRYTFAGTPEHPVIKVAALCDRAVDCQERMQWIMAGPYSLRTADSGMGALQ
jgi:TonB family protein